MFACISVYVHAFLFFVSGCMYECLPLIWVYMYIPLFTGVCINTFVYVSLRVTVCLNFLLWDNIFFLFEVSFVLLIVYAFIEHFDHS